MFALFFDENLREGLNLFKLYRKHKKQYEETLLEHRNNCVILGFYHPASQESFEKLENLKVQYYNILKKIKDFNNKNNLNTKSKSDIQIFVDFVEDQLLENIYVFNEKFFDQNDIHEFFTFIKTKKQNDKNTGELNLWA